MSTDTSKIYDQISSILQTHSKVDVKITPQTLIATDLAIDSVEMFDLVMEIEEQHDISFPLEEASEIDTVQSLVDIIERLLNV